MKNYFIRTASILLLITLISTTIVSCTTPKENTSTVETSVTDVVSTGTTTEVAETVPEYNYPEVDYEGHEFLILNQDTCNWANCHIAPEDLNGELINDALYNRNTFVEEKCNITIKEFPVTDVKTTAIKTITAEDDIYDMIPFPINELGSTMTQGYFVNLLGIDTMNFDDKWWDQEVIKDGIINDKLYFASSDISLFPFEATWIMYFDETVLDNLGLEYPYQLVRDGKWTIDRLIEYAKAGASLNGDESFKYNPQGNATYGMITHGQFMHVLLCAADEMLISKDENSIPYFSGDNKRLYSLASKIVELTKPDGYYLDRDNTKFEAADNLAPTEYHKQRFLFMSETLGHIANLRDLEHDFGVVPAPKYQESQENYNSMIATWGTLFTTVPVTNKAHERTGVILDMLAYQSYKNLMEPYYETYLTQKGTRNENSADMLKIVRDTRTLNTGFLFGWTSSLLATLAGKLIKGNPDIAADVAKQIEKINTNIGKTIEFFNE